MSLRELYQEMIIDHGRTPRNFGVLAAATHHKHGQNPLCGDKLTIYLEVENEIVKTVKFEGTGCAISVASASLMTDAIQGKPINAVMALFENFHHLVTTGNTPEMEMGKLNVFGGVAEFPARVKCASLAWHTLKAALQQDDKPVTTE